MKNEKLEFYCDGCACDFFFEGLYKHECKKSFGERRDSIKIVFRCRKCHSAFDLPQSRNEHELWCSYE